jgi:hypothetical protein
MITGAVTAAREAVINLVILTISDLRKRDPIPSATAKFVVPTSVGVFFLEPTEVRTTNRCS